MKSARLRDADGSENTSIFGIGLHQERRGGNSTPRRDLWEAGNVITGRFHELVSGGEQNQKRRLALKSAERASRRQKQTGAFARLSRFHRHKFDGDLPRPAGFLMSRALYGVEAAP